MNSRIVVKDGVVEDFVTVLLEVVARGVVF